MVGSSMIETIDYQQIRIRQMGVIDAHPKEYRDIVKEFDNTFAVQDAMKRGFTAEYIMQAFKRQIATHMEEMLNETSQNN